jgi:hypothetical protein
MATVESQIPDVVLMTEGDGLVTDDSLLSLIRRPHDGSRQTDGNDWKKHQPKYTDPRDRVERGMKYLAHYKKAIVRVTF